jgi:hypothetical protein
MYPRVSDANVTGPVGDDEMAKTLAAILLSAKSIAIFG